MNDEKSAISHYHYLRNLKNPHRQRLRPVGFVFAFLLIASFALFLLPLFLYMLFFNRAYFWIRNQNPVALQTYFHFSRHRIAHLSLTDRIWCEYCEWANGSLQWISDIVKEIERRYCPIKTACDPHCAKAKEWRNDFLDPNHTLDDLKKYFFEGGYESVSLCEKK